MKKIIIADDNKTFLMYLGLLLKRFDFKVVPAENGLEVLKLLKLSQADVVLLDINMKLLDGYTVLRYLKEDRQTSHIPVIMVSSDSTKETVEKCTNLGCFDFLFKPIKVDKLHDCLQRCFFSRKGTNRRYLRTSYNGKVTLEHDGNEYELYAETLSEGGVYIRKEEPFSVGSKVALKCDLGERGSICVKGSVIYTKRLFGDFLTLSPGMAIAFADLAESDATALKLYIEDRMAGDIFDSRQAGLFER